jgi:threonine dehydratase
MIRHSLEDLRDAHIGLAGVGVRTPLLTLPLDLPVPVRLKAEQLQPIGAFKIRGAWTALRRLPAEARARGVVTSSSGNHGLGLAHAAQELDVRAVIVMPHSAPQIKQDGIRRAGAEVRLVGAVRGPEQGAEAERLAREEGLAFIPPYDHLDVISGQATCTLEILEEWPEVETIVVPVGGGGLLAGACVAARALGHSVRIVGVEPAPIPKLSAAMAAGRPTDLPGGTSLADGLLTRSVGDLTWPLISGRVHEVIGVTDDELREALRWLDPLGIRAEPSGAATVAAIRSGRLTLTGPTAVICSGGNIDPARYQDLVS